MIKGKGKDLFQFDQNQSADGGGYLNSTMLGITSWDTLEIRDGNVSNKYTTFPVWGVRNRSKLPRGSKRFNRFG